MAGWTEERTSRIRRVLLAGVAAFALAAAGCGGDGDDGGSGEDSPPTEGEDLTALYCPLEPAGQEAGQETYKPAEGSFNTAELIGMKLADASAHAAEYGCEVVVSVADGKGQPVPIDIDLKRIYVYTENEEVTLIENVGGGL